MSSNNFIRFISTTELETCERCEQPTIPEWGGSEWTPSGYLNFDILCHDCFTELGGQTHD